MSDLLYLLVPVNLFLTVMAIYILKQEIYLEKRITEVKKQNAYLEYLPVRARRERVKVEVKSLPEPAVTP